MYQNFDRLKVFYHIYTQGGVAGAATVLHVTQPAVSQSLHKLEEELGSQLFTRQHKRLIPTSAGDQLFKVIHPFMNELEVFRTNLAFSKNEPFGELRIGAPPEFGKTYLPNIVAQFRKRYPHTSFYLKLGAPDVLLPLIEEGKLDLALVDVFPTQQNAIADKGSAICCTPLFREHIILACSKEYHAANIQEATLDNLLTQDYIEYERTPNTLDSWFKHHYRLQKSKHRTVITVDDHLAVITAIMSGAGLGIIASHLVAKEISQGDIIPIIPSRKDMINQVSLVELRNKQCTLAENAFKEHLTAQLSQMTTTVE